MNAGYSLVKVSVGCVLNSQIGVELGEQCGYLNKRDSGTEGLICQRGVIALFRT